MTRGLYVDPHAGRTLFADHATRWMSGRNTEATTAARDASVMRTHVLPQWGSWPLNKIDHAAVQAWVTALGKQRSPDVGAKCYQLTAAVLRLAVSNRLLAFNPGEDVRLPPRRKHDSDERIVTAEELVTVLLPVAPDRYCAIVATAGGADSDGEGQQITTTLQLYTRRTDDEDRILDALTDKSGGGL